MRRGGLPTSVYRYSTRTGVERCRVTVKANYRCLSGGTFPLTDDGIKMAARKAEQLKALQKRRR